MWKKPHYLSWRTWFQITVADLWFRTTEKVACETFGHKKDRRKMHGWTCRWCQGFYYDDTWNKWGGRD